TNTVYEATTAPASLTFQDPAAAMQRAIDAGTAKVTGESTLDGKRVFVVEGGGVRYLVDEQTYEALLIVFPNDGGNSRRVSATYVPATSENLGLLDERVQHPDASVETVTPDEFDAQGDRLRAGIPGARPRRPPRPSRRTASGTAPSPRAAARACPA